MDLKILKLNMPSLSESDVVYGYYERNYKFSSISGYGYNKVPILESASNFISHEHLQYTDNIKLKYPHKSYIEGFMHEYSKPLSGDLDTDEGRKWILRYIQPNPEPPIISYKYVNGLQEKYFSDEMAEEYGVYNAKAYKVWEFVIDNLPFYEKVFTAKQDKDIDGLPIDALKKVHKEHKDLWKPISQDDFIKLFDRKVNPSTKLEPLDGKKGEVRFIFNELCVRNNIKNREKYLDDRINAGKQSASKFNSKK